MLRARPFWLVLILLAGVLGTARHSVAQVYSQCPDPTARCLHLAAGDGFIKLADGKLQYIFGFSDVTGVPDQDVMMRGALAAAFPAPTLVMKEGEKVYLNLTNVGMPMRPDLFDAHSVHFHGFPNAAPVFDGLPEASVTIKMGNTFTYFYNLVEPGTYLYHCHVEATEHMQMGMLGNLYVKPRQDGQSFTYGGRAYTKFAYNDGDGSTGYDVDYPLQLSSFDSKFHDLHLAVQPLPFAAMRDDYAMINGRGYPDTVEPGTIAPPTPDESGGKNWADDPLHQGPQAVSSHVTATSGQRVLLRLSNVSVTTFFTVQSSGIPMKVVGLNARLLRGPDGKNLYYDTQSINLGGGESADVILDTTGIPPGTYFLYTSNLNYLSNGQEDLGGMMTEIVIQ